MDLGPLSHFPLHSVHTRLPLQTSYAEDRLTSMIEGASLLCSSR